MRGRTSSSSIRMNASTAAYAEPECPAGAIKPDTEPGLDMWLKLNAEFSTQWPNITVKRDPLPEAKEMDGVEEKYEKYFLPNRDRATETGFGRSVRRC